MGGVCPRLVMPVKAGGGGGGGGGGDVLALHCHSWPLPPTEIMMCRESYSRHFEKIKRHNLCPWGKLQFYQGDRMYAQRT